MIPLKSRREIALIKESGRIVAQALLLACQRTRPGMTTSELNAILEKFIISQGGKPAFKGFRGFPASTCISVNEEVVHGIPGSRLLKEGDLVSVDIGVEKNAYFGDGAVTFGVGSLSSQARDLVETCQQALSAGIEKARVGARLSDISHAVQSLTESRGFSVVRDLVGHGIGKQMHEDPQVANFGPPGKGPRLQSGMVLAIEPMITAGHHAVATLEDNWTVVTTDGSLAAHYEHTVAITEDGPVIMTRG
ncbi:MAG: methionine aminopeptidase [candidate division Zixibacteria bacterium SM23_81]|nr:MAG: methionine aminopeptidase [candidate division Zixibacteria bacterium SM23_81]